MNPLFVPSPNTGMKPSGAASSRLLASLVLGSVVLAAPQAKALNAGDLIFTALNADEDGWAMVALAPIPANTTVYFTDNEWDGSVFNTGESYTQWESGASIIPAGAVVRFLAVDHATNLSASAGTLTRATVSGSSNWGISSGEDSVYAYQAATVSSAPTAFLSAICNTSFGTATAGLLNNTGLTVGNGALQSGFPGGSDFSQYNGTRSGQATFAAYLPIISNVANWTVDTANGVHVTTVPNTTALTIAAATPTVNLSLSASSGTEAGTTAIIVTATASAAVSGDQAVALAVSGTGITAGDYTLSDATITIPGGSTTGSVTFTIANDLLLEGAETATLTISSPTAGIALGATTARNVAITDDEASVDLSKYARIGRYDLPEPTRTTPPANNLLAQEASGVTYNWDTDTLFIVGDGGTSVTEVTKTGALVSSMTLAPGGSPQGTEFYDTEGITYIGGGQFVMTEERDRQAVKFTYLAGGTLTRAAAQTVKLGTPIGNVGLEGLSYDPQTSGFIFTKESNPQGLFQTMIDFTTGTASNGSPTTVNSSNLFDPALANLEDMSDVFAFSNLPVFTGQPDEGNLLILSQESGMIRHVDRSGNILGTLTLVADAGNPLSIQNQTHEGITMDRDGMIYVVSEGGGGDTDHPQLWVFAPSAATNVAATALALSTASTSIPENQPTTTRIKMATLVVTDADGVGVNQLTVGGADAASFEIVGSGLYLKAGTVLSYNTKSTYNVTVNVDDTTVGAAPDAFANFTLILTQVVGGSSAIKVTEVAPWSSGNSPLVAADWFELTNTGSIPINISNWRMYDGGAGGFGSSGLLNGIASIAPGETVIFVDGSSRIGAFVTNWYGASPPVGLQIGSYGGPGLSTGGDAVNIYDAAGAVQASVAFGASDGTAPYQTFDNTAGLNNTTITQLSALGDNGAFTAAATTNEIGSPGTAVVSSTVLVSITATDASAAETATDPGTFRISRTGSTILAMDVVYSIATGAGQATSGDYTPTLASPATIPAGQSFVDVTLTPVDDVFGEDPETVTLTLSDTGSYDVGSPATATVTITDNDSPNAAPTAATLNNAMATITEITPTTSAVKVADIVITDDVQGTNTLAVTGTDAAFFEITGSALYLKAGTTLGFATKPGYSVTVEVDDTTVGTTTPDASVAYALAVLKSPTPGSIIVSEISPWSSSAANSPIAVDWFEVTNLGTTAANINGWKWNDSANSFATAVSLAGVISIAPGESVIFLQTADLTGKKAAFKTLWFGANPPAGLQFGNYTGPGMSSGGDAVNLYDTSGNKIAGVSVGASPASAPFTTFDNAAGLSGAVTLASVVGVNGAFAAVNDANEIGSPARIANPSAFESWLVANGYTSLGIDSDSDSDGLTDGVEFFFNQNPNNGGDFGNLPQIVPNGGALEFHFTRLTHAGGLTGDLLVSGDLDTWTPALSGLDYTVAGSVVNGGETSFTYTLPGTGPSAAGTSATYLAPNTSAPFAVGASLGGVRIVNEGLVGAGRISGESLDSFGETQGAASGLFITDWRLQDGQLKGTFNVLPDRGYNTGTTYSNYAARLHRVAFTFTPYYGAGPVAQNQIGLTYLDTTKFTYQDGATTKFTTGLNPAAITGQLFGQTVGLATGANGPGGAQESLLAFDAEAVHLFSDGSGFVSDEYGAYIARFNPAKQITGLTQLPEAARPHRPVGSLNFDSSGTPAPLNGRRNNQGLEGLSVTPDGTRLFALLQSATIQDTGANASNRNHARLFVYDVAGTNRETPVLIAEYVVKLPRIDANGNSSGLDATAAQSEIVAIGDSSFLMLPRDGNGMGKGTTDPIVFKSVQLVDFASATNILGNKDAEAEPISPGGTLIAGVNAAATAEVINLLDTNQLAKFGFNLNPNNSLAADSNTLNEKMEGMALVSDLSTPQANDFFLFIANDNDFQSSNVRMLDASGNFMAGPIDGRPNAGITNDAIFYAYRVTISGGNKFFRMKVN